MGSYGVSAESFVTNRGYLNPGCRQRRWAVRRALSCRLVARGEKDVYQYSYKGG